MKMIANFIAYVLLSVQLFAQDTDKTIVISDDLKIIPLSENALIHDSMMQVEGWGNVSCNGLIYINNGECYLFDTPANDSLSEILINWLENVEKVRIKGVVVNHYHDDCLGGLAAFHKRGIPSYANIRTLKLAANENNVIPHIGFDHKLVFQLGDKEIVCEYFGEAHTTDNIVAWFPADRLVFGGCMIKSLNAGKGNLNNANTLEWPSTIRKVKKAFPDVQTVVPGHGKYGDIELLDYTIRMFSTN